MRNSKVFVMMIALLFSAPLIAQPGRTITGVVISAEESSPLEGVAVFVKGSKNQSGSQPDGIYYISVGAGDSVLVFRHDGYKTEEIKLSQGNEYNVVLRKNAQDKSSPAFPAGNWRGVFQLKGNREIPFNFEIDAQRSKAYLLNAEERFEAGNIKEEGDSLIISLDQFDNELAFKIDGETLRGVLRKQDGSGTTQPLIAEWNKNYRFMETAVAPESDISGTYDVTFKEQDGSETKTVGLFKQQGKKLSAVFLRTTGDSRFLEGIVEGSKAYLSSFIGSSASYYEITINKDKSITGQTSGFRGGQNFSGKFNPAAALPDPYSLTFFKPGYTRFDFSFPDLEGKQVSLKDEKYKNKVVIVTITGTWCPNCIDEAAFLSPWYEKNKNRGVEAIALHYERQLDSAYLHKVIGRFRKQHNITYDEVIAGTPDKRKVAESLPALNSFLAFPTILFIDKKGNVAKIYTGFNGPATGKYYAQFQKEFNAEVDRLLKQ